MQSNQWKLGQVGVKAYFVGPPVLVMTTLALLALLSLMHIIKLVAVVT